MKVKRQRSARRGSSFKKRGGSDGEELNLVHGNAVSALSSRHIVM